MKENLNHFDFLNAINQTKENLIVDEESEKKYSGFMVNRGLSQFVDTALIANEMNIRPHLPAKCQNDFLINIVRFKKRFSKWTKPEELSDIEVIKDFYGYSNEKARQVLKLLSPEQLTIIKNKVNKGGIRK